MAGTESRILAEVQIVLERKTERKRQKEDAIIMAGIESLTVSETDIAGDKNIKVEAELLTKALRS